MLTSIAQKLHKFNITPNQVTMTGVFFSVWSAQQIWFGNFQWAALLLIVSGVADLLDGKLARLGLKCSKYGALLDSSMDRYSDAFCYGALLFYFIQQNELVFAGLAFSACMASFQISYVRARSEGLDVKNPVGFWERGERMAAFLAGLITGHVHITILLLGVLPHLTAIARLRYGRAVLQDHDPVLPPNKKRWSPAFMAQAVIILLLIALLDIRP